MGLISGFIKGSADAAAKVGEYYLVDQIQRERDEANALRDAELNRGIKAEDRAFQTSEREAEQEFQSGESDAERAFKAGESAKDRAARQSVAEAKASAEADASGTTKMQNARDLIGQGYPKDVANAVAQGALKQVKDEETGDMVLINALNNKPVGRLTSSGGRGPKQWVPAGEQVQSVEPTTEDIQKAIAEYDEKASPIKFDTTQFGMTEKQWKAKRAKEIAQERAAGIVGGAMKQGQPQQKAPQAALDYLEKNPDALPQFIEKYGYDPTRQ